MQQGRFKSIAGFTLVELMVVVGIIGVLAAVAIPQFRSYQAKAKQSEAKILLSSIFMAEEAYKVEYNYATCLKTMGINGSTKTYRVGFAADQSGTVTNIPSSCSTDNATFAFQGDSGIAAFTALAVTGPIDASYYRQDDTTATAPSAAVTNTGFIAQAEGNVGGATTDIWVINHKKALVNFQAGI